MTETLPMDPRRADHPEDSGFSSGADYFNFAVREAVGKVYSYILAGEHQGGGALKVEVNPKTAWKFQDGMLVTLNPSEDEYKQFAAGKTENGYPMEVTITQGASCVVFTINSRRRFKSKPSL